MNKALFLISVVTILLSTAPIAQVKNKADVVKALAFSSSPAAIALRSDGIGYTVKDAHTEERFGLDHVYLQQIYKGIIVYNVIQSLVFKNNQLQYSSGKFISDIASKAPSSTPSLNAATAIKNAATYLGLSAPNNLSIVSNTFSTDNKIVYSNGGISKSNINTELVWVSNNDGKTVHLAWNVMIEPIKGSDYWHIRIDAATGNLINKGNYTVYENSHARFINKYYARELSMDCLENKRIKTTTANSFLPAPPPPTISSAAYNVVAYPNENIWVKGATLENNPWALAGLNNNATTYGWHFDGTTNYMNTRGNNVYTYDDSLDKNAPGRPDTSTTLAPNLTFNYTQDSTQDPTTTQNRQFAEANLFYWNNILHDISYQYGFDEASGNFQQTNTFNGVNRGGKETTMFMLKPKMVLVPIMPLLVHCLMGKRVGCRCIYSIPILRICLEYCPHHLLLEAIFVLKAI